LRALRSSPYSTMLRSVVFFVVGTSLAAADEDSNSLLQGYRQMLSEESSVRVDHDHDSCDGLGLEHDGHCHGGAKEQFICEVKCPAFKVMIKNDMLDTDHAAELTPTNLIPALKKLGAGPVAQAIFNLTLKFHLAKLGRDPETFMGPNEEVGLDIRGPMTFPAANSPPDETTQGFWMEQAFSTGITDRNTVRQFDSSRFNEIFGCEDGMEATPVGLNNMSIAGIKAQHDMDVLAGLDQKGFGTASPLLQYSALFDLYGIGVGKLIPLNELRELLRDGTFPKSVIDTRGKKKHKHKHDDADITSEIHRGFEVPGVNSSGPTPMVMTALGMEGRFQYQAFPGVFFADYTDDTDDQIKSAAYQAVYTDLGYCHGCDVPRTR